MKKKTLGFCMTGSFCTFSKVFPVLDDFTDDYDVIPVMSQNAATIDSRFGRHEDFIKLLEEKTGKSVITTIEDAEPIGGKGLCDAMIIMPCTGNTAAKLANGVTDTSVTMAAKGHLRNGRPLIIAISSNDALGANFKNIGLLYNTRNVYFVPFSQDDPKGKPTSLVADFSRAPETVEAAFCGLRIAKLFN